MAKHCPQKCKADALGSTEQYFTCVCVCARLCVFKIESTWTQWIVYKKNTYWYLVQCARVQFVELFKMRFCSIFSQVVGYASIYAIHMCLCLFMRSYSWHYFQLQQQKNTHLNIECYPKSKTSARFLFAFFFNVLLYFPYLRICKDK